MVYKSIGLVIIINLFRLPLSMRIKDMPWWNRPDYKLKKGNNPDPAELLAIILEKGINLDESSIELANKFLKRHNFHNLADLSLTELQKEVGEIRALKLKSMFEIYKKTARLEKNFVEVCVWEYVSSF
jgi:DNA repair protein RadC